MGETQRKQLTLGIALEGSRCCMRAIIALIIGLLTADMATSSVAEATIVTLDFSGGITTTNIYQQQVTVDFDGTVSWDSTAVPFSTNGSTNAAYHALSATFNFDSLVGTINGPPAIIINLYNHNVSLDVLTIAFDLSPGIPQPGLGGTVTSFNGDLIFDAAGSLALPSDGSFILPPLLQTYYDSIIGLGTCPDCDFLGGSLNVSASIVLGKGTGVSVPEPSSILFLSVGLVGLAGIFRWRGRSQLI
jgi:PEP-CTERM motif-containing protein